MMRDCRHGLHIPNLCGLACKAILTGISLSHSRSCSRNLPRISSVRHRNLMLSRSPSTKSQRSLQTRADRQNVLLRAMEEQVRYLTGLAGIERAMLAAESSAAVADIFLAELPNLLPFAQAAIFMPDPRRDKLSVLAARFDGPVSVQRGLLFDLSDFRGEGSSSGSFLTGDIQYAQDLLTISLPQAFRRALSAAHVQTLIDIPLLVRGEVIGSLHLYSGRKANIRTRTLERIQELADVLAIALYQSNLHWVVGVTQRRFHALARRQLQAEEMGRRRISRDLHDMVGQNLTALNINLHFIAKQLPPDTSQDVRGRLEDSGALIEEVVRRIRDLMADLRPSILDDLGLTPALRWYTREFSRRTELNGVAQLEEIQPRLLPEVETSLFRIAQEALTNIAKHSQAKQFVVRLEQQDDKIVMAISDDGVGFDFGEMRHDPTKTGVGIVDMRERAEAIRGQLWVECQIGKGTCVWVRVPRQP